MRLSARTERRNAGFTLLELLIAMMFVALLASGIVLTVSTALRVWKRAMRMADLQQEARSTMGLLERDIRGAYLGIPPKGAGYFIAGLQDDDTLGGMLGGGGETEASVDPLELTTESSGICEVALLPDEVREGWDQETRPPVTDMVGVRWEGRPADGRQPAGLYRTTSVVPVLEPEVDLDTGEQVGQVADELISTAVRELRLRYFDGEEWQTSWNSADQDAALPKAVEVVLTLSDAPPDEPEHGHEYTFESVVTIAAQ